jgi:methyl-accepting chemotaxis protein
MFRRPVRPFHRPADVMSIIPETVTELSGTAAGDTAEDMRSTIRVPLHSARCSSAAARAAASTSPFSKETSMPHRPPSRIGDWFAGRPVGVKVGAAVGILAFGVLASNALAVHGISALRDDQEAIYTENLLPLNALAEVQRAHAAYRVRTQEYAVSDDERRAELLTQMREKTGDLEAGLADYEPFVVDHEAMDSFASGRAEYVELVETELLPAADTGDLEAFAEIQSRQLQPLLQTIADDIEAEGVAQSSQAAVRNADAAEQARSAVGLLVATALGSVSVATALTVFVVRRISLTVRSVQRSAEAMAAGDLTVPTGVTSGDQLGRMAAALDSAQGALREALSSVVTSADAVATSPEKLSASSA